MSIIRSSNSSGANGVWAFIPAAFSIRRHFQIQRVNQKKVVPSVDVWHGPYIVAWLNVNQWAGQEKLLQELKLSHQSN